MQFWNAVFTVVVGASAVFGGLALWKPRQVLDLQQGFYRWINWRIEPGSMDREILLTRAVGVFLIVFSLGAGVYYWLHA